MLASAALALVWWGSDQSRRVICGRGCHIVTPEQRGLVSLAP
jgi:hypothetical protein